MRITSSNQPKQSNKFLALMKRVFIGAFLFIFRMTMAIILFPFHMVGTLLYSIMPFVLMMGSICTVVVVWQYFFSPQYDPAIYTPFFWIGIVLQVFALTFMAIGSKLGLDYMPDQYVEIVNEKR